MQIAFIHIFAGLLSITAGFFALAARKGGPLHRRSGTVFVCAMAAMTIAGGTLAAMHFEQLFQKLNVIGASLTFYLVMSGLLTVKANAWQRRRIVAAEMALALVLGVFCFKFGIDGALRPKGSFLGFPAAPAFIFGTVALLAALGDARLLLGRVLDRPHRIARHLWRMCFGMFVATASFFLGQMKVFPEPLRIVPLLAIPVLLVLVLMFFWWARVLATKRVPHAAPDLAGSPS
ncbi:MAG: hypothetical protein ACM3X5_05310 [Bacillota bacterium]